MPQDHAGCHPSAPQADRSGTLLKRCNVPRRSTWAPNRSDVRTPITPLSRHGPQARSSTEADSRWDGRITEDAQQPKGPTPRPLYWKEKQHGIRNSAAIVWERVLHQRKDWPHDTRPTDKVTSYGRKRERSAGALELCRRQDRQTTRWLNQPKLSNRSRIDALAPKRDADSTSPKRPPQAYAKA